MTLVFLYTVKINLIQNNLLFHEHIKECKEKAIWEVEVYKRMWKWKSLSYLTLWDPMDCTVHGILQARILEWVAFSFFRDLPNPGIEPRSPTWQKSLTLLFLEVVCTNMSTPFWVIRVWKEKSTSQKKGLMLGNWSCDSKPHQ